MVAGLPIALCCTCEMPYYIHGYTDGIGAAKVYGVMVEWAENMARDLAASGDATAIATALDEAYGRGQADKTAEFIALIEAAKASIQGLSHYEIGLNDMALGILAKLAA